MMDFQATRWTMAGEVPQQTGNDHPTTVPTGLFHTADGMVNLAAGGDEMWRRIVETLGLAEEARAPELATEQARSANRAAVNAVLQAKLLGDTAVNWIERLNKAGVPTGPVYSMDQVFADRQVQHLGLAFAVQHPRLGEIDLVRSPIQMPGVVSPRRPTPERGEHTDAVLAEFGFTSDEIATLREEKAL
jgi:crotonobetainyl-CoA:carnitine CoA-transferase CaiB-like acyl-CoA transferase